MSGINFVTITGNLGADPELRMHGGGTAILKLRVATNDVWFDKEQKKQERTEWHRVTVFGKRAEGLSTFLKKGMFVSIVGSLRTTSYDKEGQKHYSTEIICDQLEVAPRGSRDSERAPVSVSAPFAPFDEVPPSAFARSRPANGRSAAASENIEIPF